jgi:hypothetical protein
MWRQGWAARSKRLQRRGAMKLLAIALTATLASHAADAQDARQDASDKAQADISVCLAFYTIAADCIGGDDGARAALRRLGAMSARRQWPRICRAPTRSCGSI